MSSSFYIDNLDFQSEDNELTSSSIAFSYSTTCSNEPLTMSEEPANLVYYAAPALDAFDIEAAAAWLKEGNNDVEDERIGFINRFFKKNKNKETADDFNRKCHKDNN